MELDLCQLKKMCFTKTRFNNLKDAKKKAEKYKQRTYNCHICGGYHLTSQTGEKHE